MIVISLRLKFLSFLHFFFKIETIMTKTKIPLIFFNTVPFINYPCPMHHPFIPKMFQLQLNIRIIN